MAKKRRKADILVPVESPRDAEPLLGDLRRLIDAAREQIARAVNAGMTLLYWSLGDRIRREILREQRATYGKQIVEAVSRRLTAEYGRGFSRTNLFNMVLFAEAFPQPLNCPDAVWTIDLVAFHASHPLERFPETRLLRRNVPPGALERWSARTLRAKIQGMLFERAALAKKPDELIRRELDALRDEDQLTPDLVFRDPYLLDFLRLHDSFSEEDLELAILRELEAFLLELGGDFTFVARQKRITVDHEDYYLDLLFFHRRLRRLVAIELKLGKFQSADKGQMELYLRWLEAHEVRPGEEPPLGLILCAEKSTEHVELLRLEQSGIRVAEYLTELPPRSLLEHTLHKAIRLAHHRLTIPSSH